MAFHPQPKTHTTTLTETEPLEDRKDKGCWDDELKKHHKQLFCISRATAVGGGLTGAAGGALDCQSEQETEYEIGGRVTSRRESPPPQPAELLDLWLHERTRLGHSARKPHSELGTVS